MQKQMPLPINVYTAKGVPASDRIQERRKLVAAKLGLSLIKRLKHITSVLLAALARLNEDS